MPADVEIIHRLYFREGTSDKEYLLGVQQVGNTDTFNVVALWGRRGSASQSQVKTKRPESRALCDRMMERLASEKRAKGYQYMNAPVRNAGRAPAGGTTTTAASALAAAAAADNRRFSISELRERVCPPMLLTPIDRERAISLILDNNYLAQPKYDGVRCELHREGSSVYGISRTGKDVGLPSEIVQACLRSPRDFVVDGEKIGSTFVVFDVLKDNTLDMTQEKCEFRMDHMRSMITRVGDTLYVADTAKTASEKQALYDAVFMSGGEGVVFKLKSAYYEPGRSKKAFKRKFWSTASVIVGGNKKAATRSFGMYLCSNEYLGNCTVAVNQVMPPLGAVAEVRYLYRSSDTGGLVQPTFLSVRHDVEDFECTADQLQVKDEEREES